MPRVLAPPRASARCGIDPGGGACGHVVWWRSRVPITTQWTTRNPTGSPNASSDTNATVRYRRRDGSLEFEYVFQFGAASAISTPSFYPIIFDSWASAALWPPLTAGDFYGTTETPFGSVSVSAYDDSANAVFSGSALASSIVTEVFTPGAAFLFLRVGFSSGNLSSSVPFTWAANDLLVVSGTVEAFGN